MIGSQVQVKLIFSKFYIKYLKTISAKSLIFKIMENMLKIPYESTWITKALLCCLSGKIIGLYLDKYCVKFFGKTQSFNWNTSLSLRVIWNNLLKDFQYLSLVKSCHTLLTVGIIVLSNPRPQLVTDATHFAWIGPLLVMIAIMSHCIFMLFLLAIKSY